MYKRIKELRKELNMTQEELAQKLGYDRSSISKIEKGLVDLSIDKVKEFAQALHCNPSYLMGWNDSPDEYDYTIYDALMKIDGDNFRPENYGMKVSKAPSDMTVTVNNEELVILECYRHMSSGEKDMIKRLLDYDKRLNQTKDNNSK